LPVSFWQVIAGFICMQLGSGLIAMFALLSNHVVEDSIFVQPDEQGRINCTWGEHQLRTTDDYSPDSSIISFFFSGLNHHVAHHLFPKYCHVHYPVITKIVRETAAEFGLRYRYNSITGGLQSHFRLLKKLSRQNQPA
jgi:linoleoyl-CoA desaturase